jgi:hypothetical protein
LQNSQLFAGIRRPGRKLPSFHRNLANALVSSVEDNQAGCTTLVDHRHRGWQIKRAAMHAITIGKRMRTTSCYSRNQPIICAGGVERKPADAVIFSVGNEDNSLAGSGYSRWGPECCMQIVTISAPGFSVPTTEQFAFIWHNYGLIYLADFQNKYS